VRAKRRGEGAYAAGTAARSIGKTASGRRTAGNPTRQPARKHGRVAGEERAVEMFRARPNAELCVVPDHGHCPMPKETVPTFLELPFDGGR
jgi:hypothetical protein